ncbi:MAG: hypothetical protein ACYC8V_14575 [Caulobacteraceae bacterium]
MVDGAKTLSFAGACPRADRRSGPGDTEHARITQTAPEGTTLYLNDPTTAAMSEAFTAGSTIAYRDYIMADGGLVALRPPAPERSLPSGRPMAGPGGRLGRAAEPGRDGPGHSDHRHRHPRLHR